MNNNTRYTNKTNEGKKYVPGNFPRKQIFNDENFPKLSSSNVSDSKLLVKDFSEIFNKKAPTVKDIVNSGWISLGEKKTQKNIVDCTKGTNTCDNLSQVKVEAINYDNLTALVTRWQQERDIANEQYGENSPYWNEKNLLDPLSDDDLESESESDSDDDFEMNEDIDQEFDE